MPPVEKIAALYEGQGSFKDDLEAYLLRGYVISTPTVFLMFRAVDITVDDSLIKDPWHEFDSPNAWYVFAYAGKLSEAEQYMPYPLPIIALDRMKHGIKFYQSDIFFRKLARF